jgi:hypothetical protein
VGWNLSWRRKASRRVETLKSELDGILESLPPNDASAFLRYRWRERMPSTTTALIDSPTLLESLKPSARFAVPLLSRLAGKVRVDAQADVLYHRLQPAKVALVRRDRLERDDALLRPDRQQ